MKIFYCAESVDSRSFLAKILSLRYGVSAPRFAKNEHGKPYLVNSPLCFNLSHSGKITAVAVCEQPVGLDIEARKEGKFSAVSRRFTPAERKENFFTVWTAKEAYIKFKGSSLAHLYSALEYKDGALFENGTPVDARLSHLKIEGCAACVCTAAPEEIELIRL